jgi:hypothetical protein
MRLVVEQRTDPVQPLEASEDARHDEASRAELLARIVECTVRELRDDRMTRVRAAALVDTARLAVLDLFPGSEATYNLLLAPRFARLLDERFGRVESRPASILPFRLRSA